MLQILDVTLSPSLVLGCPVRSRELDSMIQLEIFCDSKQLQKAFCELFLIYADLKEYFYYCTLNILIQYIC